MNYDNLTSNFNKVDPGRGFGDPDYALHELAHFVVLFRRAPRMRKQEFEDMAECLDVMTCGHAQLHELRVLKLEQLVVGDTAMNLLNSVWSGIHEAAYACERGQKDIVTSKTKALRLMKDIKVSPRLVQAYRRVIARFS